MVFIACSAIADEIKMPAVNALLHSLRWCSKAQPVWPVYTSGHVAHIILDIGAEKAFFSEAGYEVALRRWT